MRGNDGCAPERRMRAGMTIAPLLMSHRFGNAPNSYSSFQFAKVAGMIRHAEPFDTAAPYMPRKLSLPLMREAVQGCRGCDLYLHATQAVFGEGTKGAMIMFIGEQPGDAEDRAGQPFIGPAGKMFDKALQEAGIDRKDVYVTNAVKHFKYEERGKRRIHGKPNARQIRACRPWLEGEIAVVKPKMIVALGATAAQSLFGSDFRVSRQRGQPFKGDSGRWCMAMMHPSSLLRAPDKASREAAWKDFLNDMKVVAKQYGKLQRMKKLSMK
jgi:uracil-DNA glycosylase